jgi:hypothetical protein
MNIQVILNGARGLKNLGGFIGKTQIPLNPPFPKGDFRTPLWKRGAGGIFILGSETFGGHGRLKERFFATLRMTTK